MIFTYCTKKTTTDQVADFPPALLAESSPLASGHTAKEVSNNNSKLHVEQASSSGEAPFGVNAMRAQALEGLSQDQISFVTTYIFKLHFNQNSIYNSCSCKILNFMFYYVIIQVVEYYGGSDARSVQRESLFSSSRRHSVRSEVARS
jgi:hypothetical protein